MGVEAMDVGLIASLAHSLTIEIKWAFGDQGDWIRTSDPHSPRVVRYQAALRPDLTREISKFHQQI